MFRGERLLDSSVIVLTDPIPTSSHNMFEIPQTILSGHPSIAEGSGVVRRESVSRQLSAFYESMSEIAMFQQLRFYRRFMTYSIVSAMMGDVLRACIALHR